MLAMVAVCGRAALTVVGASDGGGDSFGVKGEIALVIGAGFIALYESGGCCFLEVRVCCGGF